MMISSIGEWLPSAAGSLRREIERRSAARPHREARANEK
jgi:hypothetical protein